MIILNAKPILKVTVKKNSRIRRVDIPIPFSMIPNLPPLGDNLEDLTIYDTVTPPQSRRVIMYTPIYQRY